jgi:hypothetical protein
MYVFIPSVTVKKSAGACQRIQRGRDLLGDYFWCSSFLVLGIKINLYGNVDVTSFFLCLDQLAFWQGMGTIDYAPVSTTILRFAVFHPSTRELARVVVAKANLCVICFTSWYFSSKQEQGMRFRKNFTSVCSSALFA